MRQETRARQESMLNRHKIQNVIGRKSQLLSQIEESKVTPSAELNLPPGQPRPKIARSFYGNSISQSQNESFQRRTHRTSMNRGNTTLGGTGISKDVFRTLLIHVNIDRIVFGYVALTRTTFPSTRTRPKSPSGTTWTSRASFASRTWARTRCSSPGR